MMKTNKTEQLTVFRFIAASIVVIFHFGKEATGLNGIFVAGSQMVTFFFVLSGFVLGLSYLNNPINIYSFWVNRIARILPAYLIALLLMLILHGLTTEPIGLALDLMLLQAFFYPYTLSINPPGWSLSVEAFFYLTFPFIAFWIRRQKISHAQLLGFSFMFWLTTQFFSGYALTVLEIKPLSLIHNLIYYFPLTHLCCFLLGISGAMYFRDQLLPNSLFVSIFAVALFAALVNYQDLINEVLKVKIAFRSTFYAPLFLLLIMSIASNQSAITNFLKSKSLVLLGESSYALYILQTPVFEAYQSYLAPKLQIAPLASFLTYFAILIFVSIACFLFFEKPVSKYIKNLSISYRHRRAIND